MMMLHEQMVVEIIEWGSVSQHYLLNTSWFVHMPSFRCKWTRRSCLRQFLISSVKMWRRKKNREENRIISTQQGHKPTTTCDRIPSRRESRAPRQSPASHTHTRFNNSRGLGPAATVSALWRAACGHQTLPRASLAVSPPRRWHLRAQATAAPSHRSPGRTYATAGAWGVRARDATRLLVLFLVWIFAYGARGVWLSVRWYARTWYTPTRSRRVAGAAGWSGAWGWGGTRVAVLRYFVEHVWIRSR